MGHMVRGRGPVVGRGSHRKMKLDPRPEERLRMNQAGRERKGNKTKTPQQDRACP